VWGFPHFDGTARDADRNGAPHSARLFGVSRLTFPAAALAASAAAAATFLPASGAAAPAGWSGSASCTIMVKGPGYEHSETQKWQLGGPTSVRGSFRFVPSRWTDTGTGSSTVTEGDQSRTATWTVKAAAPGRFQFVVRASDGKLLIGQANAQLRVQNGITGIQRVTIGGVAQAPGSVGLEAFETQLPRIVVVPTKNTVSGSMGPTHVIGSFGPFQPGAARATKSCSWRFAKS
jgi:hypothetical protein